MVGQRTVLVTGATGNVGRHVVAQLLDTGARVRALVRDPRIAALPDDVELVRGDLTEPESLRAALDGVGPLFLLWPFLSAEGAAEAVDVLAEHPRRIVYVSAMAVQDDLEPQANGVWGQVEDLIKRSGLEWTFLRASGFATNTLGWADQIRVEGIVRWPYGDAARSLIHERDIAAVAVRALTEDRHTGATYVLTGPEAVTQAEQVRIIGEVVGLPVHWEELAPEVARQQLVAAMGDSAFADSSLEYWARLRTEPEPVTRTVEEVTGTPARTFAEWARDHADDFRRLATAEVAEMYVSSFRTGNLGAAFGLLSPDMVRAAPMEGAGEPAELRGLDAIMENSQRLNADYEIHGVDVDDPLVNQDRFAVRFAFDETHIPTGKRRTTAKVCLYTVADGRVTREEVYYHEAPHLPA